MIARHDFLEHAQTDYSPGKQAGVNRPGILTGAFEFVDGGGGGNGGGMDDCIGVALLCIGVVLLIGCV